MAKYVEKRQRIRNVIYIYNKILTTYRKYGFKETLKKIFNYVLINIKTNYFYEILCDKKLSHSIKWEPYFTINKKLKVSIIVPNYNHASYLKQRLDSIYQQTYQNFEVLLLDDCSTDNSQEILKTYYKQYHNKTTLIINKENSGCPFNQWLKGLENIKGDLVWIAESDDWCDLNFLENVIAAFDDESVIISYSNTIFIEDGKKIWDLNSYIGKNTLNFKREFFVSSESFVSKVMFYKNAIPNASSVVFRKIDLINQQIKDMIKSMKLCGDWLFYVYIMRGGIVAYTPTTTNYYRIHNNSTSLSIQKTYRYYEEQFKVLTYIAQNFSITKEHISNKFKDICNEYLKKSGDNNLKKLYQLFPIENLFYEIHNIVPKIGICSFAFTVGGGETFPIYLANELKKMGYQVTFFDFNFDKRNEHIRKLLLPEIPVIVSPQLRNFKYIIKSLDINILHTHHGGVDIRIGQFNLDKICSHIVTLHGYYEAIQNDSRAIHFLKSMKNTTFVYTTEKNLPLLKKSNIDISKIYKIYNGLPYKQVTKIDKKNLNIKDNDFILCLVSRALESKGWKEAIEIVQLANLRSAKRIHLLLIGEGEMYDTLKKEYINSEFIHLLGYRWNLSDYFSLSDMAFFPSRYPGESFPLVNIESLLVGTPIIASNIGNIKDQLTYAEDKIAGALFDLEDGKVPILKVVDIILSFVNNEQKLNNASEIAKKMSNMFTIRACAQEYIKLYNKILRIQNN